MANIRKSRRLETVGLIPAAGHGNRLAPLPCSKELYPIGVHGDGRQRNGPKVVSHYLLESMRAAGITKAYVVLRQGKWDIPAYFGNGGMLNMDLAYLIAGLPFGPPYTLDAAYPFVQDTVVAFGFPDILFESESGFTRLLDQQQRSNADVVLGLFPADEPHKMDMVDIDEAGRVRDIVIQPAKTELCFSWDIAVWGPTFTRFLHDHLEVRRCSAETHAELSVGHVLQAAVRQRLRVEGSAVSDKPYLDIGTPEGLNKAIRCFSAPETSA
jgi:glucose-1-phosphate thymidylyltransferase